MPMIGHDAIGKYAHSVAFLPFFEYLFKLFVFFICIENMRAGVCAINDMIYDSSYVCA